MTAPDARDADALDQARRTLRAAGRAVVLTGAGVSVPSGVPTFRGEDGLWKEYRPEELATPRAFDDDPRLVWEWYAWRRGVVRDCDPNEAHRALARWTLRREGVRLVTQNVDGLHRAALEGLASNEPPEDPAADEPSEEPAVGASPERAARPTGQPGAEGPEGPVRAASIPDHARTVELHGSLFRTRCTGCGRRRRSRENVDASSRSSLPRCGECGGLLRPDVVWFGESLPREALEEAIAAARRAGACLVVGTSAAVQPAASVATVAAEAGSTLVEVNPERTPLTGRTDFSFRASAEEVVPALLDAREPSRADDDPPPADGEAGREGGD